MQHQVEDAMYTEGYTGGGHCPKWENSVGGSLYVCMYVRPCLNF